MAKKDKILKQTGLEPIVTPDLRADLKWGQMGLNANQVFDERGPEPVVTRAKKIVGYIQHPGFYKEGQEKPVEETGFDFVKNLVNVPYIDFAKDDLKSINDMYGIEEVHIDDKKSYISIDLADVKDTSRVYEARKDENGFIFIKEMKMSEHVNKRANEKLNNPKYTDNKKSTEKRFDYKVTIKIDPNTIDSDGDVILPGAWKVGADGKTETNIDDDMKAVNWNFKFLKGGFDHSIKMKQPEITEDIDYIEVKGDEN